MIYPWQQTQWQQQIDAVKQNKLAHALMLVGPKGVGKNHFARNLAQRVLCGIAGEKPCGSCRDCELFAVGNHPDFINLELLENSKSIKIDQVRELTRALNQTSQRGGYQVAIIHAADTLNQASANALLKTLEEPPGEVLIILLVEQTGRLPATIHSRCQRMNFSAENNLAVQSWLRQKLPHEQDLELLLKLANNAPLQAIALSEADIFKVRTLVLSQLQALVESKIDPVGAAEVLLKAELSLWLPLFISLAADISRLQLGAKLEYLQHHDCVAQLEALSAVLSISGLQNFMLELNASYKLLTSSMNPNLQLQIERLCLGWQQIGE